jgi:hypothetical protein
LFHKRRHQRVKRRFACEFLADGQRYRGIIVELSRGGLFIQSDATTAPGTEIEIQLAGAGAVPELRLRGLVVRRRMVPAPLATAIRRGIAVEILEAPREYGLACGSELLEAPIRLTRSGREAAGDAVSGGGAASAPRAEPEPAEAAREPAPATPPARAKGEPEREARPEALLIDDGTLGDVEALLRELAVDTLCLRVGAGGALPPAVRPTRLFITTARLACSLLLPASDGEEELVGIAVAEDESQTLSTLMRRLGFHYLVHRPTHPEALRLLLRWILYRGADQRRAARVAFGAQVAWRSGWRRRVGPMVEISANGCRLLSAYGARTGARVRISIPPGAAGGRRIVLRGRIARRKPRPRAGPNERYALAVAFDPPSPRMRERLDALLARAARGPASLPRPAPDRVGAPATAAPEPGLAPGDCASSSAALPERRRAPRVRLDREVVSLDESETRVRHVLLGRDLSALGMRVEPHPELALGQRLPLALYEPCAERPLLLAAEVARDDGAAGLALRFVEVAPEAAEMLARILASLPALESLRPEPARIVLGELLRGPRAA